MWEDTFLLAGVGGGGKDAEEDSHGEERGEAYSTKSMPPLTRGAFFWWARLVGRSSW